MSDLIQIRAIFRLNQRIQDGLSNDSHARVQPGDFFGKFSGKFSFLALL